MEAVCVNRIGIIRLGREAGKLLADMKRKRRCERRRRKKSERTPEKPNEKTDDCPRSEREREDDGDQLPACRVVGVVLIDAAESIFVHHGVASSEEKRDSCDVAAASSCLGEDVHGRGLSFGGMVTTWNAAQAWQWPE